MNLLSSEVLAEIRALNVELRRAAGVSPWARSLLGKTGGRAEFADRRSYAQGDELRSIDWRAYARSSARPVVKRFAAEQGAEVRLLLDTSLSLSLGTPTKLLALQSLAAALSTLALSAGASVVLLQGTHTDAERASVRRVARAQSLTQVPALLHALQGCACAGGTQLPRWLSAAVPRHGRPGLLIVLSDCMDVSSLDAALRRARSARCDVALIQILAPEELDPQWHGDLELESIESGQRLRVHVGARAHELYAQALQAQFTALSRAARSWGHTYIRHRSDHDVRQALRQLVLGGVLD